MMDTITKFRRPAPKALTFAVMLAGIGAGSILTATMALSLVPAHEPVCAIEFEPDPLAEIISKEYRF